MSPLDPLEQGWECYLRRFIVLVGGKTGKKQVIWRCFTSHTGLWDYGVYCVLSPAFVACNANTGKEAWISFAAPVNDMHALVEKAWVRG